MQSALPPGPVRYRLIHETRYDYSATASSGRHLAHLTPRQTEWQEVLEHAIEVRPAARERITLRDYFGNDVMQFALESDHTDLVVHAESVVVVRPHAPDPALTSPPWESALPSGVEDATMEFELAQFRVASPQAPLLDLAADYAARSFTPRRPWLDCMLDLTRRIKRDFAYDQTATSVSTPVREVLEHRRGVCQDFAHLMISCLRSLQLPARYVSGYVLTARAGDPAGLTGSDASHAWIASFSPVHGWVAFDPTNGKLADTEFVTLGWGREFSDVTPLRGVVLGGGSQKLTVRVSVKPIA